MVHHGNVTLGLNFIYKYPNTFFQPLNRKANTVKGLLSLLSTSIHSSALNSGTLACKSMQFQVLFSSQPTSFHQIKTKLLQVLYSRYSCLCCIVDDTELLWFSSPCVVFQYYRACNADTQLLYQEKEILLLQVSLPLFQTF